MKPLMILAFAMQSRRRRMRLADVDAQSIMEVRPGEIMKLEDKRDTARTPWPFMVNQPQPDAAQPRSADEAHDEIARVASPQPRPARRLPTQ
ncbi:MAG TPA: hypothetical protein VLJ57_04300 [Burkholderiaceae bacterium]|nr:hypothetical protein [Burkholderiaceae bacterium]